MKRILAAAALAVVSTANAEELKFGDLNYFLKSGQFNLVADANVRSESTGPQSSSDEINGQHLDTKFAFGITDSLNVFIGLTYNFDVEVDFATAGRHQADGLQSPSFGANYRVMKQDDYGFNLDVGTVVKYGFMDYEVSNDSDSDVNTASPILSKKSSVRDSIELNARLGNKWNEANEYYLIAGIVHNLESEYDQTSAGGDTEIELGSALDIKIGGFYQYRPVNEFMVNFGLVATQVGETSVDAGGVDQGDLDSHVDLTFTFEAKYLVTDNTIVRFNYLQGRNSDYDFENTEIEKRREHQWGFGVDWLF